MNIVVDAGYEAARSEALAIPVVPAMVSAGQLVHSKLLTDPHLQKNHILSSGGLYEQAQSEEQVSKERLRAWARKLSYSIALQSTVTQFRRRLTLTKILLVPPDGKARTLSPVAVELQASSSAWIPR